MDGPNNFSKMNRLIEIIIIPVAIHGVEFREKLKLISIPVLISMIESKLRKTHSFMAS